MPLYRAERFSQYPCHGCATRPVPPASSFQTRAGNPNGCLEYSWCAKQAASSGFAKSSLANAPYKRGAPAGGPRRGPQFAPDVRLLPVPVPFQHARPTHPRGFGGGSAWLAPARKRQCPTSQRGSPPRRARLANMWRTMASTVRFGKKIMQFRRVTRHCSSKTPRYCAPSARSPYAPA